MCYLFFQLVTHPELGSDENDDDVVLEHHLLQAADLDGVVGDDLSDVVAEVEEQTVLSVGTAVACLAIISILVALHCQ